MGYFRDNVEQTAGYMPGFQPKATDVVKLNTNENPYPPSPAVMKALVEMRPEQFRRYPDPMATSFREAAAEIHGVSPDNILCCNGGDELLAMAIRAICDERRALAYPVPTYTLYPVLAKLHDCPILEIPFDGEFNLPAKLASTGAALTIVCNPNAPTGSLIRVEELASLASELKGVLLIDEAYADFAAWNCVPLIKDFPNVIILRTLSKGYSLAGLRFGYAIADKGLIDGLAKVKDSYNVDAVAIALATAAIRDRAYFQANVEKIKQDRRTLTEQLRAIGFSVPESHSNFVFAQTKNGSAAPIHEELSRRNIFVRYWNQPGISDKLRISVGTQEQNERLIAALKEIVAR
ncbi:MAG TPA: histidinol-phosphate transaminase [Sedimentisphaerales bacterium]|nr:histidinol-phosphate transaminase [Phycisphaerae bacterium]HON92720.1 histidinol-phosphate transaminase [Sedimentisphaerales bacterium]HQG47946.1 histidinol-phosphate transaminase [Sedimentisphaerales bacterium]HQI28176.1 histidinol-phosphate transaminase [Sedimentisphaerales bacterium]